MLVPALGPQDPPLEMTTCQLVLLKKGTVAPPLQPRTTPGRLMLEANPWMTFKGILK